MTLVAAALTGTFLWLLLEPRHCLWVEQARTLQILVVLVPIFLQSAPHMPMGLMAPESSTSHLITPVAGATRVGMIDMAVLLLRWCGRQGSTSHSASPETSARVGSTGRGSAICRGALSLKTLSFTQGISRAHPFGRERFSRAHTSSGASVRRTRIAIVDWWCCGPFGPSACHGGGVVARRRLVRFS
jgi:hypothetical protein